MATLCVSFTLSRVIELSNYASVASTLYMKLCLLGLVNPVPSNIDNYQSQNDHSYFIDHKESGCENLADTLM